ncbi:hypothetical protein Taro_043158 [Colocasia esculenta]|uniref:Uncharacterized protein n=1 Tax=Colocasia esculenta TaxID=4460 RepID=A0A843WKB4_COLES|nr:hypothetical protein [Colocasia esculenta]
MRQSRGGFVQPWGAAVVLGVFGFLEVRLAWFPHEEGVRSVCGCGTAVGPFILDCEIESVSGYVVELCSVEGMSCNPPPMGHVEELLVAEELWNAHTKPFFFPFSSAATCTNRPLEVDQRTPIPVHLSRECFGQQACSSHELWSGGENGGQSALLLTTSLFVAPEPPTEARRGTVVRPDYGSYCCVTLCSCPHSDETSRSGPGLRFFRAKFQGTWQPGQMAAGGQPPVLLVPEQQEDPQVEQLAVQQASGTRSTRVGRRRTAVSEDRTALLERFLCLRPLTFFGDYDPNRAESWTHELERTFETMECTEEDHFQFALEVQANDHSRGWTEPAVEAPVEEGLPDGASSAAAVVSAVHSAVVAVPVLTTVAGTPSAAAGAVSATASVVSVASAISAIPPTVAVSVAPAGTAAAAPVGAEAWAWSWSCDGSH